MFTTHCVRSSIEENGVLLVVIYNVSFFDQEIVWSIWMLDCSCYSLDVYDQDTWLNLPPRLPLKYNGSSLIKTRRFVSNIITVKTIRF